MREGLLMVSKSRVRLKDLIMTRYYHYVDRRFGKVFVIPAFLEYAVLTYGNSIIDMNDEELHELIDAGECGDYCTMNELHKLQAFLKQNEDYDFTLGERVFEVNNRFALCDSEVLADWDYDDMDVDFLCDPHNLRAYLPACYIYVRR